MGAGEVYNPWINPPLAKFYLKFLARQLLYFGVFNPIG